MIDRKTRRLIDRLEIENQVLKEQNNKHMDIYRQQCLELIDLRCKLQEINLLTTELYEKAAL